MLILLLLAAAAGVKPATPPHVLDDWEGLRAKPRISLLQGKAGSWGHLSIAAEVRRAASTTCMICNVTEAVRFNVRRASIADASVLAEMRWSWVTATEGQAA
jgi:hypothetical protein